MNSVQRESNQPKRILHVINGMGTGGAEKDIINWYRNIDRSKFQFDFLVRTNQNFYKKEIEELGGKFYTVAPFPRHFIKNFRETRKFLKEHKEYDTIHVHGNALIYIYPLVIAKQLGIKKRIFHAHNTKANGKLAAMLHRLNRLFISRCANIRLACSQKAGEFSFGNHSFTVLNNAMDMKKYHQEEEFKACKRKQLGLENSFVVGHVGRFIPVKNHRFVIEVFQKIHQIKKNSVLLLIGDGELREELEQYVDELNLNGNVRFLGERSDVEELIPMMDVMVFPSFYEGMPLVVLEAQASGTPIVYSDIIDDKVKLTPFVRKKSLQDSAEEWAEETVRFAEEEIVCDICDCFQKSGYTIESVVRQLMEIYGDESK